MKINNNYKSIFQYTNMAIIYALVSVVIVSLISVLMAVPLLMKKKISQGTLLFLLSLSVGALLSTVFMDFLPEAIHEGYTVGLALSIIAGFVTMLIIEKFVHHHHDTSHSKKTGHGHAYSLAPITLIGDGIHNFIDGLVIAGSYAVNVVLGITATIAIIFHEVPQELADFGVLLYSGMTKKKALLFNFISAISAILGVIVGFILINNLEGFNEFLIPFAAGNFIYIAAASLVPQLHRHCGIKDTIIHLFAIALGVGIITLITIYGPAHIHG